MPAPAHCPPPIRTDHTNAFANNTVLMRIPAIIREVQALNPDYSPSMQDALDKLRHDLENGAPVPRLALPAPDFDDWEAACAAHAGETWLTTEWFFAETYFYRLLMQVVRWWESGRDPFAPKKAAELGSDALWHTLQAALAFREGAASEAERLDGLIQAALWGNRIDLSYATAAAHGSAWATDDLLADSRGVATAHLLNTTPGPIHLIADNTGTELATDLVLIAGLLDGVASTVILHVKLHPTFVSDATHDDVLILLERMESGAHGAAVGALGRRLHAALDSGWLRLAPDAYWNSSRFMWDLPPRLERLLAGAKLVILKGDANYRRLVGDAIWPAETPFVDVAAHFPAPLLVLRTLKSDPVVGLPAGLAVQLDGIDRDWRVNGKRGLIQFSPGTPQVGRSELLRRLREGRTRLDTALAKLPPIRRVEPGVLGTWSVKDILTHVIAHEQRALQELQYALRGERLEIDHGAGDNFNAQAVAESGALAYEEVRARWDRSFQQIVAAVESLAEDAFAPASRVTAALDDSIDGALANNTYEHYAEHIAHIEAWLDGRR